MHLFYTPDIDGNSYNLDEQESKHAIRVLRLGRGDEVILVDGRGTWYKARISEDNPKSCILDIYSVKEDYLPLPYQLHIAISPTKNNDRFEWFLEKATEIGISGITPLLCQRTERNRLKTARLERILVSAMKQSLRAFKPVLHEPLSLKEFLSRPSGGSKCIAHCMPKERTFLSSLKKEGSYTFLVGPEGDFTEEEVQMALASGYRPLSLGPSRLRTETAGVHLCSAIQLLESQTAGEGSL